MRWWSDKHRTGKRRMGIAKIVNLPGQPRIEVEQEMYEAGIGDLVVDLCERLMMPWWKRWWHIGRKSEISSIKEKLNRITMMWGE